MPEKRSGNNILVLHIFLSISILLGIIIFSERLGLAQEPVTASLNSLIDEACRNNPAVKEAHNRWKAAEYKVKEVSGLPDPMASYTYFGESVQTRVGPQKNKYGLSQKIPFPGKLSLKAKTQLKNAEILKEKYEATLREIIKEIKFVYYDIFWVDKSTQITEEEKVILEHMEKSARVKYESNLSPQQDVIKTQVELSKIIERLFLLEQNRKALVAKLNSILNRSQNETFGKVENLEAQEFTHSLDELYQISQSSKPELLAANLDIERAQYEKSLAKSNYLPDFTLGFDYIQVGSGHTNAIDDGKDAWTTTIAVHIPLWFDKVSAQVNEKKAALQASRDNYQNIENRLNYEIEDLYSKIATYRDIVSLYKTALIPQAEQSFEAAKTSYETGKVDFLNWLDSEKVLLQTKLAYYKTIVDYQKSIAYLERMAGADL
ncbi:MAG: TolC family protein [Candidatus Omnitrophota bacterium]